MNKNMLVLAYMGDSIYESYIREYLINKGISKVKELQSESIKFVSAKSQSLFLDEMINNNFLSEDELKIVMCARNHKNNHKPKYTDIITYKKATGIEALIGYLYFEKNIDRINEIMNFIVRR